MQKCAGIMSFKFGHGYMTDTDSEPTKYRGPRIICRAILSEIAAVLDSLNSQAVRQYDLVWTRYLLSDAESLSNHLKSVISLR